MKALTIYRAAVCLLAVTPSAHAAISEPSAAGNTRLHAIGWQTFDNAAPGDNNSGIADATPDSNSTFDSTPTGSFAPAPGGGVYLTGIIGEGASILGRSGYGQSTNDSFLQGATFGSQTIGSAPFGINLEDVTLADGSPGSRLNTQGQSGSSWKFRANGNQEFGDFSIRNESDYTFRLERIHYDARAGNTNSPTELDVIYLAGGDSNLVRADDGMEVLDLRVLSETSFATQPSTENISSSVAAALFPETAVRLAPGDSASFRFRWTGSLTDFAESQIDNLALSGTFLDQNNGFAEIDPTTQDGGGPLPGDANGDGVVDLLDLDILGTNFGLSPADFSQGDFNNDNVVDLLDLDILGTNFGATSPANATPEPAALTFLITLLATTSVVSTRGFLPRAV